MAKDELCCPGEGEGTPRRTAASRIFDTAKVLFYQRGIRAVGVDEIVCEAGVTKPSLYRAYKSKDDLLNACLEDSAREGRVAIMAVMDAAGPDPRDRLRALVGHYSDKIRCPEFYGCPMSNVAIEMREPGHPSRQVVERCKTDMGMIVGDLTRAMGVMEPAALADGIILLIEGAIASHHVFGSQGPAQMLMETCDMLIAAHVAAGPRPVSEPETHARREP